MFPWHGEGKGHAFDRHMQHQQQHQQQQPLPPLPLSRQDATYNRWRFPSALQRDQNQIGNDAISNSTVHDSGKKVGSLTRKFRGANSGDDAEVGEEEEEGGREEEEEDEEEEEETPDSEAEEAVVEDVVSTSPQDSSNASNNLPNHLLLLQHQHQHQQRQAQGGGRLGERMPPLGYPPRLSRQKHYARRLNTEEETKLFELCVKNGSTFGERSKLCEWWKNIANEFIEKYGGPYSWHSVRRKVDLVTRERIRYLADLKAGKVDANSPSAEHHHHLQGGTTEAWKRVLDEWIPIWERFEVAEKKRIEVRDARAASRKRKEPDTVANGSSPSSPAPASSARKTSAKTTAASSSTAPPDSWQSTPQRGLQGYHISPGVWPWPPPPPPPPSTPAGSKLPDGYDTMFRNSPASVSASASSSYHHHYPPPYSYPPQSPYYPQPQPASTDTNTLASAVLETLSKLNKHLEKAEMRTSALLSSSSSSSSSSHLVAALTAASADKTATNDSEVPRSSGVGEDGPGTGEISPAAADGDGSSSAVAGSSGGGGLDAALKQLRTDMRCEFQTELSKLRDSFTSKLDSIEQTQEMIMEMLRQEPGRDDSV